MTERVTRVVVILGSPADRDWGDRLTTSLQRFQLTAEVWIASAHKTPDRLLRMLRESEAQEDPHVYITVAGRSNALSGFVDAQVVAPVIACPPPSDAFAGLDILSSLRMPRGVAPMVVLEPENAALAAAKILSVEDSALRAIIGRTQDEERRRLVGENE